MQGLLPIVNDMIIIIFDLLFYVNLCPRKGQGRRSKICIWGGCAVIICAYFTATYVLGFPSALSSAVCMAIPSFFLFLYFSKYRDSRFILTFCMIDTVSLIVAFVGRVLGFTFKYGEYYAVIIMILLFVILLRNVLTYAEKYRKLLDEVDAGWGLMALSSVFIYFAMIFIAGYPKPMVERLEYLPIWFVFAVVVFSCYMVFIHSILKTQKISEQNKRLEREKEIYHMAYNDRLTGLFNRASYMEKINNLERRRDEYSRIGLVAIDVNKFKMVNDTMGHHTGDMVLKAVADSLKTAFCEYTEYIFRMGGDEFHVILPDASEKEILIHIDEFRQQLKERTTLMGIEVTAAVGYEILLKEDEKSVEAAYIHADKKMYLDKRKYMDLAAR